MSLEQTLIFGVDQHLVGTHTAAQMEGLQRGRSAPLLLLTNAGVIPRIGPHRFNLNLARSCARLGLASLRFDLSGLGDSRRSNSRVEASAQFIADTRAAMDMAQQRWQTDRFIMLGICSGGDIAQLTALQDERLEALVLFDSYLYPTRRARLLGMLHRVRSRGVAAMGRKLLKRWRASQASPTTTESQEPVVREVAGNFGRVTVPSREAFGQRIHTLLDRGVKILFVYSGGAPAWYNYEAQFRDMFGPLGFADRVSHAWLPRSDHTLTQPHAQQALIELVQNWLQDMALISPQARGN